MPPSFRVLQALSYVGLALAAAVIPLVALRASRFAWAAHALLVLLCTASLVVILDHWVYGGMVPWWRISIFYVAQFLLPTAVAAQGASMAARRWPAHRWLVASATVLAVFLVAGAVVTRAHLVPDMITAVQ